MPSLRTHSSKPDRMRILMVGGTGFADRAVLEDGLARGPRSPTFSSRSPAAFRTLSHRLHESRLSQVRNLFSPLIDWTPAARFLIIEGIQSMRSQGSKESTMNFASPYDLAAANARLARLHKQAADARLARMAKKERTSCKGA